jgi:hypothetical protein
MSQVNDVRKRTARRQEATPDIARITWGVLGWRAFLTALVALAAAGSFFVFDRLVLAKVPEPLVGKWGVDGGVQDGATLELHRGGSYRATVNLRGSEGIVTGRLEATAKSLTFISVNPVSGKEESLLKTVVHVGADEMTLRDPSGQITKLVRLD